MVTPAPSREGAARLLRQAEAGDELSEYTPVSPELAGLFDRMARVAAQRPGPEPPMAAKDRELMALRETSAASLGTGWLDALTQSLSADPGAVDRAYALYTRPDELGGAPADDPRVEPTAQAIVAAITEPARRVIRFPTPGDAEDGFTASFYADFAPAQAAAIRRAADLMRKARRS